MFTLTNKKILLISPEPWDHIFVSKHHYAVHLAKRCNQVFFLGPPSGQWGLSPTQFANLFLVQYRGFPQGLRFFPALLQKKIIEGVYSRLVDLCRSQFDVVWSFDNSVFFDFDALPPTAVKISHIVDLNQNFQTRRAAMTADYCFCTTALIQKRLSAFNTRVFRVAHGYNLPSSENRPLLPSKERPRALYSGNLGMPYIDWQLLSNLVRENPEVEFLFVGPYDRVFDKGQMGQAKRKVTESANCRFIGRVDAGFLHEYYSCADILLVVYQERYHADQSNPHKVMEYLGSGKMIVATYTAEYSDLAERGLFRMSEMNRDFSAIFKEVLAGLAYWNSSNLQEVRKAFAGGNSYDKQIDRIQEIIN